jgi:hypothetical protein
MRRKKSSKKRSVRRRSSMGAMGGGLNNVLGIVAGAAIGRIVANKLLPNVDTKIKNAGVALLGAFGMPKIIKGSFGTSIGAGMVAAGGIGLLSDFGVVGAIEDTLSLPLTVGQVEDGISVIAGEDDSVMAGDMSVIAGIEEEDDDYNY